MRVQIDPPDVVCKTVPAAPTTHPSLAVVNQTLLSVSPELLTCAAQSTPVSVVWTIFPPAPTAHPLWPSGWKNTPLRFAPFALLGWRIQPVSGKTATVALSLNPPAAAITNAVPSPTPSARPCPLIVTTRVSVLVQSKPAFGTA